MRFYLRCPTEFGFNGATEFLSSLRTSLHYFICTLESFHIFQSTQSAHTNMHTCTDGLALRHTDPAKRLTRYLTACIFCYYISGEVDCLLNSKSSKCGPYTFCSLSDYFSRQ